eukprot:gene11124-3184_t
MALALIADAARKNSDAQLLLQLVKTTTLTATTINSNTSCRILVEDIANYRLTGLDFAFFMFVDE